MILFIVIGFALGTIVRKNADWVGERNKRIYGWLCNATGGQDFRMKSNWQFECDYSVDKRGNIIRP